MFLFSTCAFKDLIPWNAPVVHEKSQPQTSLLTPLTLDLVWFQDDAMRTFLADVNFVLFNWTNLIKHMLTITSK